MSSASAAVAAVVPATQAADEVALVAQRHPGEDALVQVRAPRAWRGVAATGHAPAQSQTHTSAMRAGLEAADLVRPGRSACGRAARRGVQRAQAVSAGAGAAPAPCRPSAIVRSIDRLVPPPTSRGQADRCAGVDVGLASRTGRCRGTGSSWGRRRSARRCRAAARGRRRRARCRAPAPRARAAGRGRVVDVEVAARVREQLGDPAHLGRGSRRRGSACTAPGGAASSGRPSPAARACWSARSAASPRRPAGRGRASARSAPRSRARRRSTSSRRPSGAWRSISTLPATIAHAALRGGVEQRVGRGLVHGREDHRRGRAVRQQRVEEDAPRRPRASAGSA